MVNLSTFYTTDATDSWFTMKTKRGSVHTSLHEKGYTLIDRKTLDSNYSELTAPVDLALLSASAQVPTPLPEFEAAFIAKSAIDLKSAKYSGDVVSDLMSQWMQLMEGENKYLVSLFPRSYLVAQAKEIQFDDVFEVTESWGIDCVVGVFDDSRKTMFVFDQELGVVHCSFDPTQTPAQFTEFADSVNNETKDRFVKHGKTRSSADQQRIEEYYAKAIEPAFMRETTL